VPRLPLLIAARAAIVRRCSIVPDSGSQECVPRNFVVERLLKPYVGVMAHMAARRGHPVAGPRAERACSRCNDDSGTIGRIVRRDLTDSSVKPRATHREGEDNSRSFERGYLSKANAPFR
jgi:hypothetical protein